MVEFVADKKATKVLLDKRIVGEIRYVTIGTPGVDRLRDGYQYFPKSSRVGGELFESELACRKSVIGDKEEREG